MDDIGRGGLIGEWVNILELELGPVFEDRL
jgi:hypothetical protein